LTQLLSLCDVAVRDWRFTGAESVSIRSGSVESKAIIRPAYHLIPSRSQVRVNFKQAGAGETGGAPASEREALVQRNGAVTIQSLAPGVRITTYGKALGDAALGDSVLVEQSDSRQKVLARVVGPQLVELRVQKN
jgi:hypothetical protein